MKRIRPGELSRMLAREGAPRPPADLAERIKDEIPAEVRLDPLALARMGRYRAGAHRRFAREFALLAAMLLVVVGLGLWGLKTLRDHEDAARQAMALDMLLEDKVDAAKTAPGTGSAAPAEGATRLTVPVGLSSPPATPADDWGRGKASLTVTVLDERGGALPAAKVVLRRLDPPSLSSRDAVANVAGLVRFLDLPAGSYQVDAGLPGFEPRSLETIRLEEGRAASVSLPLTLAAGSPSPAPRQSP